MANGAGFHHSDQHGFGLMDSYRLTLTAAVWPLLPAMVVTSVEGGGQLLCQRMDSHSYKQSKVNLLLNNYYYVIMPRGVAARGIR